MAIAKLEKYQPKCQQNAENTKRFPLLYFVSYVLSAKKGPTAPLYYKVVVFIDPLQGLNTISIIAILYLFYRCSYDI